MRCVCFSQSQKCKDLVRFALNWNDGTMESINFGIWIADFGFKN
jgi:hypothetical protein